MDERKKLTASVILALREALDDEYKAYAVYDAILKKFGPVRPFTNIIEAEVRHADAVKALMVDYGVIIPDNPYLTGSKPLPDVPSTIEEACEIGVEAEVENAALYRDKILPAVSGYADITETMMNLRDASQNNHLPAFERCAERESGQRGGKGFRQREVGRGRRGLGGRGRHRRGTGKDW